MFKRSQQDVSDGSKSWYQDKYQHVLTQRNLLALISLISLLSAVIAAFALLRLPSCAPHTTTLSSCLIFVLYMMSQCLKIGR